LTKRPDQRRDEEKKGTVNFNKRKKDREQKSFEKVLREMGEKKKKQIQKKSLVLAVGGGPTLRPTRPHSVKKTANRTSAHVKKSGKKETKPKPSEAPDFRETDTTSERPRKPTTKDQTQEGVGPAK